jgi:histidine triad (HIT) family protein
VYKHDCLGCRLAHRSEPVFMIYENKLISCFLDHDPFGEGHVLILPKKHASELTDLDEETAGAVFRAAQLMSTVIKQLYDPDGVTLCQNGGIFNELNHFHLHVIPRKHHQSFAAFFAENAVLENGETKRRLPLTQRELSSALMLIQKEG